MGDRLDTLHGAIREKVMMSRLWKEPGPVKVDSEDLAFLLADVDASRVSLDFLKRQLDAALVQLSTYRKRAIKEKPHEWKYVDE